MAPAPARSEQGLGPPIGVGVLPSGCVAWDGQCCWVSATTGTCTCVYAHTGAPSAPCPHLPHICGLYLQKPSYSHALTACTCMQSHTHTSPLAQWGDAPSPPTPCPHSRSDVGCCALCPQGNPLQHVMGEWGAGEAGCHAKHCHQLPHVPRLLRDTPQPNMPPPRSQEGVGSHSLLLSITSYFRFGAEQRPGLGEADGPQSSPVWHR